MSDPNYPPQYQQPGSYPPAAPAAAAVATAPRTPLSMIQQFSKIALILAYVTMGAAALGAIMSLTQDGDGTAKMIQALSQIAIGAGLGGSLLVLVSILRHRLLERGQL